MTYFITLTLITLMLISWNFVSDKLSRIIILIYLGWWGFWLLLSTFNFYDLFPVSNSTYYLLVLNVVMFFTGFLFCSVFRYKNKANVECINVKVAKQYGFLKILIIVVFILAYYWLRYKNIENPGLERYGKGILFSSTPEVLFFNYFIEPFSYVSAIVLGYMIVYAEFKNITFILLSLSVFFYAGIGSGRGPVINVLIAVLLIFFIRKIDSEKKIYIENKIVKLGKTKKIKLRNISLILLIALIIFIYAAWLTALRYGYSQFSIEAMKFGWSAFFKQVVLYFTGPFRALDYGLKVYPDQVGYLFGRGTFAGIDEIINVMLRIFGFRYQAANEIIGGFLQNNTIRVGYNQIFNFAYTDVMIYYFDLDILGVIIFPFIYGFFIRKAIFLYEKKPILPTLIIVVFLFNTMLISVFKWGLQSPASNIMLIICYVWYKMGNNIKKNDV